MYMSTDNKPIGWWLKRVDQLLEESFRRVLAGDGLTRRHWQLLTAIGDGAGPADIEAALTPFLSADPGRGTRALLDDLAGRGWLVEDGERVLPTPAGIAARARIGEAVGRSRARITEGIDAEQYQRVIATLARMADNLA